MEFLVLWNDVNYAHALAKFFGSENIITDGEKLKDFLRNWNRFSSIVVLCELNWSSNGTSPNMQQLYGIELVKELRSTHNIVLPVLFVSFHSLTEVATEGRKIIKAIGHKFCRLPASPQMFIESLKEQEKLTTIELRDIQLFSCKPDGIVSEKLHQIRNIADKQNSENGAFIRSQLEKCLEEIFIVFHENNEAALSKFKIEFPQIHKENINRAFRFIEEQGERLIEKYNSENGQSQHRANERKPWKLLLLDDELNEMSELVKLLNEKGVDVICTTNAADAMKALTEDDQLRGEITIILTDYRLNEISNGIEVQQRIQGYTFLQNVGKRFQSKLLSAIVYSGMPRQFLLETFSSYKIQTEIFSKKDFKLNDTGARNYLVSRIIEMGDANYKALLALPLASDGWKDNLHNTYLLYRSQKDYHRRERELSDYCSDWVEKFRAGKNPVSPMIKGDAFKPLVKETENQTLERFEAYFKTRRLAQYLTLYYEKHKSADPLDIVPKILSFPGKNLEKDSNKRGFFSQIIGFKREEFPFGATIEELNWFDRDLQIPVLDSYSSYRNKFNETENLIGTFIAGTKKLYNSLEKTNFKYTDKRKQELNFNSHSLRPFLFDKSDLGLCLEWLDTQKEKLSSEETKEYLALLKSLKEIWK